MKIHMDSREHYLDNLRWMAMLLGVFVHTSKIENFGLLDQVAEVSNLFRMALFFLISGYLGALLLKKNNTTNFLKGRLTNLSIPLMAGIFLLNPITFWLMYEYIDGKPSIDRVLSIYSSGTEQRFKDIIVIWHLHLWFLFSLIFYVAMAALVKNPISIAGSHIENYLSNNQRIIKITGLISITLITTASVGLILAFKGIETVTGDLPWIIRITLQYTPFYITGMLLYHSPTYFKSIKNTNYTLGALVIISYVYFNHYSENSILSTITLICARAWICFFMLDIGYRFLNIKNKATALLSESIYTVYIFHFIIIYLISVTIFTNINISIAIFMAISTATIITCLGIHIYIIRKSYVAQYIFNGRKRTYQTK